MQSLKCPICDEDPGFYIDGQPFCVLCQSQRPAYLYADVLQEGPNVSHTGAGRRLLIMLRNAFLIALGVALLVGLVIL